MRYSQSLIIGCFLIILARFSVQVTVSAAAVVRFVGSARSDRVLSPLSAMFFPLLVLTVVVLLGFFVLSVLTKRLRAYVGGDEHPVHIPAKMGSTLAFAALALNFFAYDVSWGIGYGLFGACVFAAILLLFPPKKQTTEMWFFGVLGILVCLLFGFRANEFVQIVNVLTALICVGMLILLHGVDSVRWHGLWFLKMKAGFLARIFHHPFSLHSHLRSTRASGGSKLPTIIKTIALTFLVLLFFSWILSAADPIFEQLIRAVRDQAFGRVILTGILVLILLVTLTITLPSSWQQTIPKFRIFTVLELFVPALALALLFGLFLAVQVRYLFGTHADFQALGITYADYVRKGFLELLIASFFGSLLSYILILKQHALEKPSDILKLKWVNAVLLVELLLLLASAAKRDWMYIEMYGLTRVRIIGAIFLVWLLALIALLLALNLIRSVTERRFLQGMVIASAAVVLLLNAANLDRIIAQSPLPRGQRLDIVYNSRLSADAVDGWMMAISEAQRRYANLRTKTSFSDEEKMLLADAKIAAAILDAQISRLQDPRPWQEWNWNRAVARQLIDRKYNHHALDLVRCISGGIRRLQVLTKADLSDQESRRVYGYESPFIFDNDFYHPESLESINTQPAEGSTDSFCERVLAEGK